MVDFIWKSLKPFIFLFDAERAHRFLVGMIRVGTRMGGAPLRIASGAERMPRERKNIPVVFGMEFRSRVGLAAGFDKDAELVRGLPDLGFGFAEIGTVTPRPQGGNPKPRLFREPSKRAVFNRMGFNGAGAETVARELGHARGQSLPDAFRIGVNIGKNKDTPLDRAAEDYRAAIGPFRDLADYVVVNVSSPNTPGLRSLQTAESLLPIVGAVRGEIEKWTKTPPLLLKLAPELSDVDLEEIVRHCERGGVSGWVISNTLAGKWQDGGVGGWSGAPLETIARERLVALKKLSSLPVISVGGITTVEEGRRRIELGADLIQIYTGWIYEGPSFPARLTRAIQPELDTVSRSSLPLK